MLDKTSKKPLYQQLIDDILLKIKNGSLKPKDKLPTERELAEQLHISRGTVKKAYKELESDGVIEVIQGSGTYIYNNKNISASEKNKLATALVDNLLEKLYRWDFSAEEISGLLKAGLSQRASTQNLARLAIIDCNMESLEIFKKQLLYISGISISAFSVETILLEDNPEDFLSSYDLILTTTTHYRQIAEHIGNTVSKLVKVAVAASKDTLLSLSRLSDSSRVAVICGTNKFAQIIIDQIVYFVSKSDTVDTYFEDSLDFEYKLSLLQQYDAVIINPDSLYVAEEKNKQALDTYVQKGGTLIPFQYLIDNGSLIYIEERISQLFEQKLV